MYSPTGWQMFASSCCEIHCKVPVTKAWRPVSITFLGKLGKAVGGALKLDTKEYTVLQHNVLLIIALVARKQ